MMTEAEIDWLIDQVRRKMEDDELANVDVAKMTGFSESYISQILTRSRLDRKRNPGPVLVIAHALGLVWITRGKENAPE